MLHVCAMLFYLVCIVEKKINLVWPNESCVCIIMKYSNNHYRLGILQASTMTSSSEEYCVFLLHRYTHTLSQLVYIIMYII